MQSRQNTSTEQSSRKRAWQTETILTNTQGMDSSELFHIMNKQKAFKKVVANLEGSKELCTPGLLVMRRSQDVSLNFMLFNIDN